MLLAHVGGQGFDERPVRLGRELLVGPRCGGPRKVLAAMHDSESIRKVLGALGLSS